MTSLGVVLVLVGSAALGLASDPKGWHRSARIVTARIGVGVTAAGFASLLLAMAVRMAS